MKNFLTTLSERIPGYQGSQPTFQRTQPTNEMGFRNSILSMMGQRSDVGSVRTTSNTATNPFMKTGHYVPSQNPGMSEYYTGPNMPRSQEENALARQKQADLASGKVQTPFTQIKPLPQTQPGYYTQALIPIGGIPGANYTDGSRQTVSYQGTNYPAAEFWRLFGKSAYPTNRAV